MSFPPYEQPLDTSLRQIRLLDILPEPHPIDGRLQCHFTIESLLQDPDDLPYQALSYTWGRPDDFDFKIWLNGILFPVRQNLLCALRVLRASGDTIKLPIWIDALCIDQQNVSERGHQVDMMGVIYRGAQHVIAWLGTPDPQELENRTLDTQQKDPLQLPVAAFDFVARAAKSITSHSVDDRTGDLSWARKFFVVPSAGEGLRDLVNIFSSKYWERLWIVQEVCLAHKLILFLGRESLEWDLFHKVLAEFNDMSQPSMWYDESSNQVPYHDLQISLDLQKAMKSRPWQLDNFMRSDIKLVREDLMSTDLISALKLSGNCLCEDRRDKFYGILGLTTDVDEFDVPVDYSLSLFQVYANVLQNRLEDFDTDDEESTFYQDSDDDLPTIYPAGDIVSLSRTLQRSLLGPAFELSAFEEMESGRVAMLARSTADFRYLNIHGEDLGKVIACSTTLHGLRLPLDELVWGVRPAVQNLEKKIQLSLTSTESELDDSWAKFCFDLSIGCEMNSDENTRRKTTSLTMFVTDYGNVGVAPDVVIPGDNFWDYGSRCPGMAIVRGEEGSYQIVSRACHVKDWITPGGSSTVESNSLTARGREREVMTVKLNLAEIQVLTSPLRGTRDVE